MMQIFLRHICKSLVKSLIFGIIASIGILSAIYFTRIVEQLASFGKVKISYIGQIIVYMWPYYIYIATPIIFILALFYTLHSFSSSGFFLMVSSFGLSNIRIAKAIIYISGIISIFGVFISLYLMPYGYKKYTELNLFLRNNYSSIMVEDGVFINKIKDVIIHVKHRNGNILHQVFIEDLRHSDRKIVIFAESAIIEGYSDRDIFTFALRNGSILTLNKNQNRTPNKIDIGNKSNSQRNEWGSDRNIVASFSRSLFEINLSGTFNAVLRGVIPDANECYPHDLYKYIADQNQDELIEHYHQKIANIRSLHNELKRSNETSNQKEISAQKNIKDANDGIADQDLREFLEKKRHEYIIYSIQRALWPLLPMQIGLLVCCIYFSNNFYLRKKNVTIISSIISYIFCNIVLIFVVQNMAVRKNGGIIEFLLIHALPSMSAYIYCIATSAKKKN